MLLVTERRSVAMKWATLLKDFKEKVGFTNSPTSTASSSSLPFSAAGDDHSVSPIRHDYAPSPSRFVFTIFLPLLSGRVLLSIDGSWLTLRSNIYDLEF